MRLRRRGLHEYAEYRSPGVRSPGDVLKMRSVETAECWKCGVLKMRKNVFLEFYRIFVWRYVILHFIHANASFRCLKSSKQDNTMLKMN